MNETGEIVKSPDLIKMRADLFAISVTDEETLATIADFYKKYKRLLEPHGAVAWYGLNKFLQIDKEYDPYKQLSVSLETAHPAKFPDELRHVINVDPPLPPSLKGISEMPENYFSLDNNYQLVKNFILKSY
jgi:threonine synthase